MTKTWKALATCVACLCGLATQEQAHSVARSAAVPVVIGVEDDWAPFSWVGSDGVPRGYSVDVVRRVFREMGVPMQLVGMSFGRCLRDALEDKVVACFNTMYDERAAKAYLLPQTPLFREPLVVMTRASRAGAVVDQQGLQGRAVGYVQSYQYPHWFMSSTRIKRVPARSEKNLLLMLERGRVDFVLLGSNVATWKIQTEPALRDLRISMVGQVSNDSFGVAFSRRHPEGETLRRDFERTLSDMHARDAFEDARRKYLLKPER